MIPLYFLPLDSDPFRGFRQGFADVMMAIMGLVLMVSLTVTVVHVIQGEQDSAKKMFKWMIVGVVGLLLIYILRSL